MITFAAFALLVNVNAVQETQLNNSSSTTVNLKKLYTYSGPLLPSDWTLVSILNERVVIAFENGTARNARLDELAEKDRIFVERLQNGTLVTTPFASAKEKLSQWSATVTSTVSKFGKSVRDQFDSFINDKNKKPIDLTSNITTVVD